MTAIVRVARHDENANAGVVLADAFQEDPFVIWFFPNAHSREKVSRRFFEVLVNLGSTLGEIDMVAGGATVALWRPPGRWRLSIAKKITFALPLLGATGSAFWRILSALQAFERAHPAAPHWYLATIGTSPAARGQGLAAAAIRHRLQVCDDQKVGAYLEAASENLIGFYSMFGFRLIEPIRVRNGPKFYPMWRDPIG